MCTAVTYHSRDHYFGRTLDLEYSYQEQVVITPRGYAFPFRRVAAPAHAYAIIGIAYVVDDVPLYYDAVNEHGLAMAGLNFPGNAVYHAAVEGCDNIAPFEFLPWLLRQCKTVADVRILLTRINLWDEPFSAALPHSPLHWLIADRDCAITVESMQDGLHVYENPIGVLTNNPPFSQMLTHLANYRHLSPRETENRLAPQISIPAYSRGMGAMGLPGDLSSASRFVRAAYTKLNAFSGESEEENVGQFFHILGTVEMVRGACMLGENGDIPDITIYTSCCNQERGIYYYTTYENPQITAVDMHRENLDGSHLSAYPLLRKLQIAEQN